MLDGPISQQAALSDTLVNSWLGDDNMYGIYEKYILPYLLILPAMILVVVFGLIPIAQNIEISFHKWNFITQKRFVGLDNYVNLFGDASLFPKVLLNTVKYAVLEIPPILIVSLVLALLLIKGLPGENLFRGMFFIPWIVPTVNVAFLWMYMLEPEYGVFNYLLGKLGVTGPGWFYSPTWALPAVALIAVWKSIGYFCVIYVGGLRNIPDQLYEAALIDGANRWQQFRHVTLPLLSPTILFIVVVLMINTVTEFDVPAVLTGGGPADSTNLLVLYIYQRAFNAFQGGSAAAISVVTLVILLVLTTMQFRLSSRWVNY